MSPAPVLVVRHNGRLCNQLGPRQRNVHLIWRVCKLDLPVFVPRASDDGTSGHSNRCSLFHGVGDHV